MVLVLQPPRFGHVSIKTFFQVLFQSYSRKTTVFHSPVKQGGRAHTLPWQWLVIPELSI